MATLNASPHDFWADIGLGEPYVKRTPWPEPREYGPIYFDAVLPTPRVLAAISLFVVPSDPIGAEFETTLGFY